MRAIVCHSAGLDAKLSVDDVPAPVPGTGEVLVRIHAASVNFADILMINGGYYVKPETPFITGLEFAGTIEAVGAEVRDWKPGDQVIGAPSNGGCFAEYIAIAADHLLPLPAGLSWSEAASFIITYGTAWYALNERGKLLSGETLLVTGAGGGVGIAAIDIGTRVGAQVIAAAGSSEKLAVAGEHGAGGLINYSDEDIRKKVSAITDGHGYDVLLDNVGGEIFAAALKGSARWARVLLVGFASGSIPDISCGYILVKNMTVMGVGFGGIYAESYAVRQSVYKGLMSMHEKAPLHPQIGGEYKLEEGLQALDQLANRKASGKIVILP